MEETKKTIEELETELMMHPVGTIGFKNVKKEIENTLKDQHGYDKYVICFPNKIGAKDKHAKEDELYDIPDILIADDGMMEFTPPFSSDKTFMEDNRFTFMPRYEAEYNMTMSQLAVACYITDGVEIALIYPIKGRIKNQWTLIQGHVDYDEGCYFVSQLQFLQRNMARELFEEIKVGNDIALHVPLSPKYFINSNRSLVDREHFGIVYEIRIDNMDELRKSIETAEPDKHRVDIRKLSDFKDFKCAFDLDSWSRIVIDKLNS